MAYSSHLERQNSESLIANNQGFLSKVPDEDIPKMLFLCVDPNKVVRCQRPGTIFSGGFEDDIPSDSISKLILKFERALTSKCVSHVRRELQVRLLSLCSLQVKSNDHMNTIESNFSDESDQLTEEEESVLEFTEIFETFGHPLPELIKTTFGEIIAAKKIPVQKQSSKKTFFVYPENKVFMYICDSLAPEDVLNMYTFLREHKEVIKEDKLTNTLSQNLDLNCLQNTPGLKDIAFYYLILSMIKLQLLNRLYNHTLCFTLDHVKTQLQVKGQPHDHIHRILGKLNRYHVASKPPGLCMIFCMTDKRAGAEHDLKNVKELFEKLFQYDVFVKVNPTINDIKVITSKLTAGRNKYYDSLVVFFMGHGDKTYLHVKDGDIHRRRELVEPFIQIEWFNMKPKLFFIQACADDNKKRRSSSAASTQSSKEAMPTEMDSLNLTWQGSAGSEWKKRYSGYTDMSTVNAFADTLISNATMWYQPAHRTAQGSLYIDTLVDQLRDYGNKESLENVLRRVHYNVNTVLLSSSLNKKSKENPQKQAPYFESSLQKEFVFPYPSVSK